MRRWYAFAPQWIISKLHCLLFVYAAGEMWIYNAEKAEFNSFGVPILTPHLILNLPTLGANNLAGAKIWHNAGTNDYSFEVILTSTMQSEKLHV